MDGGQKGSQSSVTQKEICSGLRIHSVPSRNDSTSGKRLSMWNGNNKVGLEWRKAKGVSTVNNNGNLPRVMLAQEDT
eukprot:1844627-Ditylum_brightwellii.AAC.1